MPIPREVLVALRSVLLALQVLLQVFINWIDNLLRQEVIPAAEPVALPGDHAGEENSETSTVTLERQNTPPSTIFTRSLAERPVTPPRRTFRYTRENCPNDWHLVSPGSRWVNPCNGCGSQALESPQRTREEHRRRK